MSFSMGLRALASSHDMHWVGPLVVDTMGLYNVIEAWEIGVCGDEAFPDIRRQLVL